MSWGTTDDHYLEFIVTVGASTLIGMVILAVPYAAAVAFLLWLRSRQGNPPKWGRVAKVAALTAVVLVVAGFALLSFGAASDGAGFVVAMVAAFSVAGWTAVVSVVAAVMAARDKAATL